jgi:hypothetical protein
MGAPVGTLNAAKQKRWYEALDRAIKQDEGQRLRAAAEKLLDLAAAGEMWAVKELGDRLDGKPTQQTEISGPDGGPVQTVSKIERVIVDGTKAPNP